MEKKTITQSDLMLFTGDLDRYRHSVNRHVIYTPGVRFLADRAGAYWLIDAITAFLSSRQMARVAKGDERLKDLQFWRLDVRADRSAVLTGRADSGEHPFYMELIPYTDFPLEFADIWAGYDEEHWTLYLPHHIGVTNIQETGILVGKRCEREVP